MPVKIFVGNLSKDAAKETLEELFSQYGKVTECSILNKYAFVHMLDEAGASSAVENLNGFFYAGTPICVQRSKAEPGRRSPSHGSFRRPGRGTPERGGPRIPKRVGLTKIFVGNIKEGTENADLRVLFEAYGEVAEADVCGGYGFVHMPNQKEALKAISELRGYTLNGKVLNVELSTVNTQGRSTKMFEDEENYDENYSGGWDAGFGVGPTRGVIPPALRYDPYKVPRKMGMSGPMGRMPGRGGMFDGGSRFPPPRPPFMPPLPRPPPRPQASNGDSFAKELLELYLRDPEAFDRYAKDPLVQQSLNLEYYEGDEEEEEEQEGEGAGGAFFRPPPPPPPNNQFQPVPLKLETAPVMYPNLPPPGVLNSGKVFRHPPPPFPRPRFHAPPNAGYTSFE